MKLFDVSRKRGSLGKTGGSILIYVLWLSALLGLFTLSIGYTVRQKIKMIERIEARRSLRLAAESGVQRGLWAIHRPPVSEQKADAFNSGWANDDKIFKEVLFQQTSTSVVKFDGVQPEAGAVYGLTDEESKINVNRLKDPEVLRRLVLYTAGATEEEAGVIADSILDWIDSDDHVNASGAENLYYRGLKRPLVPKNAPLDTLEELLYVRGVTPGLYERFSRHLTLFGDGKVNLNTASEPILLAMGFDQVTVDTLVAYRQGADRKRATRDDGVFYNPSELLALVQGANATSENPDNTLENLLSRGLFKVTSDYFEVRSIASRKSGQEQLTAKAVISRQHGIQSWSEFNTRNA